MVLLDKGGYQILSVDRASEKSEALASFTTEVAPEGKLVEQKQTGAEFLNLAHV